MSHYIFLGTEIAEVNLPKMALTPTCSSFLLQCKVRVFREALSCPRTKKVCRSILPRGRGKELIAQPLLAEPCGGVDMPALGSLLERFTYRKGESCMRHQRV